MNIPVKLSPVFADENRKWQVMFNLIGNAIKFTARGKVTLSAAEDDQFVKILMIMIRALALLKRNKKNYSMRLYKVCAEITKQYGGSGLGLYISRQLLVELMNGTIFWNGPNLKKVHVSPSDFLRQVENP